jgi:hypothetical protein
MRIAVAILNLLMFLLSSFVVATDGPPKPGEDMRFVVWSLITYFLSAIIIIGSAASGRWSGLITRALGRGENILPRALLINRLVLLGLALNAVLIPLVIWHLASQTDHPAETGVAAFAIFMVLIPILNLAVLLRSAPRPGSPGRPVPPSNSL